MGGVLVKNNDKPPEESILRNQPLDGSDQGKLLIFSMLMVPSVVVLFGILPAIFLMFGIYMMKKNQDFSSIDAAVKNFRGYVWISLVVGLAVLFYWWDDWMGCISEWKAIAPFQDPARHCDYRFQYFLNSLLAPAIPIIYLFAVNNLFYSPLKRHSEWVAVNGIFSKKPKSTTKPPTEPEVYVIKAEKLKTTKDKDIAAIDSKADALLKWNDLLDKGAITQEEYDKAKRDLLG